MSEKKIEFNGATMNKQDAMDALLSTLTIAQALKLLTERGELKLARSLVAKSWINYRDDTHPVVKQTASLILDNFFSYDGDMVAACKGMWDAIEKAGGHLAQAPIRATVDRLCECLLTEVMKQKCDSSQPIRTT